MNCSGFLWLWLAVFMGLAGNILVVIKLIFNAWIELVSHCKAGLFVCFCIRNSRFHVESCLAVCSRVVVVVFSSPD